MRPAPLQAQTPAGQLVFPGAVQARPQVPQFEGSRRSVQVGALDTALVHSTGSGAKQPQTAPSHLECGKVHAFAQAPQFATSVVRSRHQGFGVAGQWAPAPVHVQTPVLQVPSPQAWVQEPQWFGSVWVSAQIPPQQLCPAPQVTPQFPQLAGSALPSTHFPPQGIIGKWQSGSDLQAEKTAPAAARARRAARRRFTGGIIPRRGSAVHRRPLRDAAAPRR